MWPISLANSIFVWYYMYGVFCRVEKKDSIKYARNHILNIVFIYVLAFWNKIRFPVHLLSSYVSDHTHIRVATMISLNHKANRMTGTIILATCVWIIVINDFDYLFENKNCLALHEFDMYNKMIEFQLLKLCVLVIVHMRIGSFPHQKILIYRLKKRRNRNSNKEHGKS